MKSKCIYPQLELQMYLRDLNGAILAKKANIPYYALRRKLRGTTPLNLDEAKKIQKIIDCNLTLDALFETK